MLAVRDPEGGLEVGVGLGPGAELDVGSGVGVGLEVGLAPSAGSAVGPDDGVVAPGVGPDDGVVAPGVGPDEGVVAPGVAPDEGVVAPGVGPDDGVVAPGVGPDDGVVAPGVGPDEGVVAPGVGPDDGVVAPGVGPDAGDVGEGEVCCSLQGEAEGVPRPLAAPSPGTAGGRVKCLITFLRAHGRRHRALARARARIPRSRRGAGRAGGPATHCGISRVAFLFIRNQGYRRGAAESLRSGSAQAMQVHAGAVEGAGAAGTNKLAHSFGMPSSLRTLPESSKRTRLAYLERLGAMADQTALKKNGTLTKYTTPASSKHAMASTCDGLVCLRVAGDSQHGHVRATGPSLTDTSGIIHKEEIDDEPEKCQINVRRRHSTHVKHADELLHPAALRGNDKPSPCDAPPTVPSLTQRAQTAPTGPPKAVATSSRTAPHSLAAAVIASPLLFREPAPPDTPRVVRWHASDQACDWRP